MYRLKDFSKLLRTANHDEIMTVIRANPKLLATENSRGQTGFWTIAFLGLDTVTRSVLTDDYLNEFVSLDRRDFAGRTALDIANICKHQSIVDLVNAYLSRKSSVPNPPSL